MEMLTQPIRVPWLRQRSGLNRHDPCRDGDDRTLPETAAPQFCNHICLNRRTGKSAKTPERLFARGLNHSGHHNGENR
jgi:hypothetical protein